ncbi:pentapeptide repeat-containing protein [Streptomyces moderatus]|nr:pentapeptide repeat-containing protein [Streptomyces moderatus]
MSKIQVRRFALLAGGTVVVITVVVGTVLLLWRGPWLIDGEYLSRKDLRSGSAALVTGFRTSVVQLAAVLGASVALIYTAFTYRLTRRGQVTDRFTKALERLGSDEPYVRIGGVLALEQIIQDAHDQASHATQVLASFLRRRAPQRTDQVRDISNARWVPNRLQVQVSSPRRSDPISRKTQITASRRAARNGTSIAGTAPASPPTYPEDDVQQALRALTGAACRRHTDSSVPINLSLLHLTHAELGNADLTSIHFWGTNLTNANLENAKCPGVKLGAADLKNANLRKADLRKAILRSADLTNADLSHAQAEECDFFNSILRDARLCHSLLRGAKLGADLPGADLTGSDLTRASLSLADLTNANLIGAKLQEADLQGAVLKGAYLNEADLLTARVTADQIISARPTNSTRLPSAIAQNPAVVSRIAEVEEEMESIFGSRDVASSSRLTSILHEARRYL